jgi:hypothetical protein
MVWRLSLVHILRWDLCDDNSVSSAT